MDKILIYKVLKGGRNCLSEQNGNFLKPGDYLHSYGGLGVVKIATPISSYQTTSMFMSELTDPVKWKNEGSYQLITDVKELKKIQPHLTNGKKFHLINNFKDQVKQITNPFDISDVL